MSQLESLSQLCQAAVNGSFGGELKIGAISSSLFQQVNKETAIAAELEIKDSKVSAKFGSSYALAAGSTLKTKVSQGSYLVLPLE